MLAQLREFNLPVTREAAERACRKSEESRTLRLAMTSYIPTNMAQVHMALARIAADVAVEGLPLPELPGARTVGDLRTLRDWPPGLRLVVEPRDFVVRVERIQPY
jgi:hypothetical protein